MHCLGDSRGVWPLHPFLKHVALKHMIAGPRPVVNDGGLDHLRCVMYTVSSATTRSMTGMLPAPAPPSNLLPLCLPRRDNLYRQVMLWAPQLGTDPHRETTSAAKGYLAMKIYFPLNYPLSVPRITCQVCTGSPSF